MTCRQRIRQHAETGFRLGQRAKTGFRLGRRAKTGFRSAGPARRAESRWYYRAPSNQALPSAQWATHPAKPSAAVVYPKDWPNGCAPSPVIWGQPQP